MMEMIILPITGFLWKRIEKVENEIKSAREEMHLHEIHAAEKYATAASVLRLEAKIDELKDLILKGGVDG